MSYTGFIRNAREAAELLRPYGVAVIGVKYRVKRGLDVALEDARQAVRTVREKASEWNIDENAIGVAGQSAGALIVLRLASADCPDAFSRPDYVIPLTSWYYGKQKWPFRFDAETPPFLCVMRLMTAVTVLHLVSRKNSWRPEFHWIGRLSMMGDTELLKLLSMVMDMTGLSNW